MGSERVRCLLKTHKAPEFRHSLLPGLCDCITLLTLGFFILKLGGLRPASGSTCLLQWYSVPGPGKYLATEEMPAPFRECRLWLQESLSTGEDCCRGWGGSVLYAALGFAGWDTEELGMALGLLVTLVTPSSSRKELPGLASCLAYAFLALRCGSPLCGLLSLPELTPCQLLLPAPLCSQ